MQSPVKIWRNQEKLVELIGKTGTIVSWTLVRVPTSGFSEAAPYPVALVRMHGGKMIMAQVVDTSPGSIAFGTHVVTVIRRVRKPDEDGIIPYGIKVRPV